MFPRPTEMDPQKPLIFWTLLDWILCEGLVQEFQSGRGSNPFSILATTLGTHALHLLALLSIGVWCGLRGQAVVLSIDPVHGPHIDGEMHGATGPERKATGRPTKGLMREGKGRGHRHVKGAWGRDLHVSCRATRRRSGLGLNSGWTVS